MLSMQSSEMVAMLVEQMRGREETDDRWVPWPCNYLQEPKLVHPRSLEAQQTFQGIARWILHAISPFMDLHGTMCAGLPSEDQDEYVFITRT